jgi:hypothetical protein
MTITAMMSARMAIVRVFTGPPDELTTVRVILSLCGLRGKPSGATGAAPADDYAAGAALPTHRDHRTVVGPRTHQRFNDHAGLGVGR